MTEAFVKGDVTEVLSYWHDDTVWYFPGRSPIAGVFHGKKQALNHLTPKLGANLELSPKAFFGDAEYGAALYELRSSLGEKSLVETKVMVCKINDSKVVETRIYPGDQYALDEFWK